MLLSRRGGVDLDNSITVKSKACDQELKIHKLCGVQMRSRGNEKRMQNTNIRHFFQD